MSGLLFVALMSIWLYRVNLHTDDTGILAGLILISSAVATSILPRGWWPVALAIGASVIASQTYRSGQTFDRHILLVAGFALSLTCAGIGAGLGLRLMMHSANKNGLRA
ncbi:MAG TPA: hypothetical protein VLN58_12410 [Verrucomicrobiae bacterium]|nr:hypothetical protein [Verrucomicrobiae bacterium]